MNLLLATRDTVHQQRQVAAPQPAGSAATDPKRQREIASLGGSAAHQGGQAHGFTSEEARAAGRKRHARTGPTGQR